MKWPPKYLLWMGIPSVQVETYKDATLSECINIRGKNLQSTNLEKRQLLELLTIKHYTKNISNRGNEILGF